MSGDENPFASPETADPPEHVDDAGLSKPQRKRLEVGEVVVAWEKRRLWYNLALTVVVLVMATFAVPVLLSRTFSTEDFVDFLTGLGSLALGANACYFAGPIVEGYATWFLGPSRWLRNVLFILGTLFAVLLTIAVCGGVLYALHVG